MMRVTVIPQELAIPRANEAFDADGRLVRPEDIEGLQALADALLAPWHENRKPQHEEKTHDYHSKER